MEYVYVCGRNNGSQSSDGKRIDCKKHAPRVRRLIGVFFFGNPLLIVKVKATSVDEKAGSPGMTSLGNVTHDGVVNPSWTTK